jgi:hypothetical protein
MLAKLTLVLQLLFLLAVLATAGQAKTLTFSGYDWAVRGFGTGGPGPNHWDETNAWVDERGFLHLRIAPRDSAWYCSEVTMTQRLGFGRYQFWIEGRVDQLDLNVVLGLFNYPTRDVGRGGTNELDIEFARWGLRKAPIGNYTVWPVEREAKQTSYTFAPDFGGDLSTQRFTWSPTSVFFQSLRGLREDDAEEVASWRFQPEDAPRRVAQQPMPVHLNLWLFDGQPPSDGKPVEIVVRAFSFTPMEAEAAQPATAAPAPAPEPPAAPPAPVRVVGPDPWTPSDQKVTLYTRAHPPATPPLAHLPRRQSVSQYGITWTFAEPAPVGQFVNGDWYVVGPVTVTGIDPKPLYGAEIPAAELDARDQDWPVEARVRNGFMVNPPAAMEVAYDSGVRNWFDPTLLQHLPAALKPGDSLVSTISMPEGLVLPAQLRNEIERGAEDGSPIRAAAVLTCVAAPQPPDAFRPAFCDRTQHSYLSRNLKRNLLPRAAATKSLPDIGLYVRFTQRPWVGTGFFGFEPPVENMPQYGREYGRVVGIAALLLCTDLTPEQKEALLVDYVQVGIDLGGMVRAGHPGWTGWGGHGSGRKLPIVFAGLLLGDKQLADINRSFPKVSFGEDEQTAYGKAWTGATVLFAGHSGIDAATGQGRSRDNGWGPYEHTPPTQWKAGQLTSESYRRCCTSLAWVAQALALRLMRAESAWHHDAFFDYVDRWMFENDATFVKTVKEATGNDYSADWARQGQAWDDFVNEMWAAHRTDPKMPKTDGWKRPHDDSYYRHALETMAPPPAEGK